jgi:hypothetical protein
MNLVILWGELGGVYLAGLLFCPVCLDASYTQNYCLRLAFNHAVSILTAWVSMNSFFCQSPLHIVVTYEIFRLWIELIIGKSYSLSRWLSLRNIHSNAKVYPHATRQAAKFQVLYPTVYK